VVIVREDETGRDTSKIRHDELSDELRHLHQVLMEFDLRDADNQAYLDHRTKHDLVFGDLLEIRHQLANDELLSGILHDLGVDFPTYRLALLGRDFHCGLGILNERVGAIPDALDPVTQPSKLPQEIGDHHGTIW